MKELRLPWTGTPLEFFAAHPVFRLDEFEAGYENMGPSEKSRSSRSAAKVLSWHVKEGRLFNVRRGLYARAVIDEPLRIKEPRIGGLLARKRSGQPLFVTSLEHTFVDCLALLERAPPPEELIVHFGQRVKSLDHRAMIDHAVALESPLVVSRLAYFFICARVQLDGPAKHLLETHGAQRPTYFLRTARTKQDRFIRRCNLIVPPDLLRFWPGTG